MAEQKDVDHVEALMKSAADSADFVVNDTLRHAAAHLNVPPDHPSVLVVLEELVARIKQKLDGLVSQRTSGQPFA